MEAEKLQATGRAKGSPDGVGYFWGYSREEWPHKKRNGRAFLGLFDSRRPTNS
jgi:hypothetical protein